MSLIQKLKDRIIQRQTAATQDYAELTRAAATNAKFPESRAFEIIDSANKTPEQFADDIDLERQRAQ